MWGDESEAVAPIIWLYPIVDAQKEKVFFPELLITLRSYAPMTHPAISSQISAINTNRPFSTNSCLLFWNITKQCNHLKTNMQLWITTLESSRFVIFNVPVLCVIGTQTGLSLCLLLHYHLTVVYSISQEICTRFCCALLCCGYAIVHDEFTWSIYPYSSGLRCWHCEVSLMDMGKSVNI